MSIDTEPEMPDPAVAGTAADAVPASSRPVDGAAPMPVTAAQLPADQGLSGLGILMELGGSIFVLVWLFAIPIAGIAALQAGGTRWLIALFLMLAFVRARLQTFAGRAIIAGHHSGALTPLRKYVRFGLAHAGSAVILLYAPFGAGAASFIGAALAIWPTVMLVLVLRTPIARTAGALGIDDPASDEQQVLEVGENRYKLPLPGDNGYESLAVLMFLLGAVGAAGLLMVFGSSLPQFAGRARHFSSLGSTASILILALLAVRSVYHLRAAVAGLRGATTSRFEDAATRYCNMGVYAAIIVTVCWLMFTLVLPETILMGPAASLGTAILMLLILCLWPRIVRHFVRERSLAEILDGDHLNHRAQDKGLTALGWLLLALGLFDVTAGLRATGIIDAAIPELYQAGVGARADTLMLVGLSLLSGAVKIFAGVELVRMTPRYKLAAWVFVALGLVIAVIGNWSALHALGSVGIGSVSIGNLPALLTQVAVLSVDLILPVTTLVLIRRVDALPSAQASFRR